MPSVGWYLSHTGICGVIALVQEPSKQLAGSIGGIGREPLRLQAERRLASIKHGPGCGHLVIGARRRCLNVDDDSVLDINHVVEAVEAVAAS
jgi:hypothetical protein